MEEHNKSGIIKDCICSPPNNANVADYGNIVTDEAVRILGKAKSTIYGLAREGRLPAYKVPGEKEWKFVASELVEFVKGNKRESSIPTFEEMEAKLSRSTLRRK